jgi:hypothetical protein
MSLGSRNGEGCPIAVETKIKGEEVGWGNQRRQFGESKMINYIPKLMTVAGTLL